MCNNNDNASCNLLLDSQDPFHQDWLSKSLMRLASASKVANQVTEKSNISARQIQPQDMHPCEDSCYDNYNNSDPTSIPFTVITWNIWFACYKWQSRLKAVIFQILCHNPDVFCFQEVTAEVYNCMLWCKYLRERYDPTEERLPHGYDAAAWVRKDDRASCGQGYKKSIQWQVCSLFLLRSIFGRHGLIIDLEVMLSPDHETDSKEKTVSETKMRRVRLATAHLESGRQHAPTRHVQLNHILAVIRDRPRNKNDRKQTQVGHKHTHVIPNNTGKTRTAISEDLDSEFALDASILVGDFNFDPTFPDNELIESNCIDVWEAIKMARDYEFTINMHVNKMYFEAHGFGRKWVCYDCVVLVVPEQ